MGPVWVTRPVQDALQAQQAHASGEGEAPQALAPEPPACSAKRADSAKRQRRRSLVWPAPFSWNNAIEKLEEVLKPAFKSISSSPRPS